MVNFRKCVLYTPPKEISNYGQLQQCSKPSSHQKQTVLPSPPLIPFSTFCAFPQSPECTKDMLRVYSMFPSKTELRVLLSVNTSKSVMHSEALISTMFSEKSH